MSIISQLKTEPDRQQTETKKKIKMQKVERMLFPFPFFFWPCCAAFGILIPQSGIEPTSPAVGSPENNYCFYVSGEDDEGCGHEKVKIPGDLTEEGIVELG